MKKILLKLSLFLLLILSQLGISFAFQDWQYSNEDGTKVAIVTNEGTAISFYYNDTLIKSFSWLNTDFILFWGGTLWDTTRLWWIYSTSWGRALTLCDTAWCVYWWSSYSELYNYKIYSVSNCIEQDFISIRARKPNYPTNNRYYSVSNGTKTQACSSWQTEIVPDLRDGGDYIYWGAEMLTPSSWSSWAFATSPWCYIKHNTTESYSTTYPLDIWDYTEVHNDREMIITETNTDVKTIVSFSGHDELLNLSGAVFEAIDNNRVSFDTTSFTDSDVSIRLTNTYWIGGVQVHIPHPWYYHIQFPNGTFLENEDGTRKKFTFDDNVEFNQNYDYINIIVPTNWTNNLIDKITLKTRVINTQEEEICTELTDEAKENFWTGFTDTFTDFKAKIFDTSDCWYTTFYKPSCWFWYAGNFIIETVEVDFLQEFVFSLWNIINFSIPQNYEVSYSLPSGKNGLFWDFEKQSVDLTQVWNPSGNMEYINTEDTVQLKFNGQVMYTNEKNVFAKFLDIFIPVIVSLFYIFFVVLFIGILLSPIIWFYYLLHLLVWFIQPDTSNGVIPTNGTSAGKTDSWGKTNLIAFWFYLALMTPLYVIFVWILSHYIMFFAELSYEFRGFLWNFFNFLLEVFQFTGVSIFTITDYLNNGLYALIWLLIIYKLVDKFWRIN